MIRSAAPSAEGHRIRLAKMIAGSGNHNVFICDECIELCSEILEEELGKQEEEDVEEEAPRF